MPGPRATWVAGAAAGLTAWARYGAARSATDVRYGAARGHQAVRAATATRIRRASGVLVVLGLLVMGTTGVRAVTASEPTPAFAVRTYPVHPRTHPRTPAAASDATTAGTAAPSGDSGGQVVVPAQTQVATVQAATTYFAAPNATQPVGTIPATWHGAASALPVLAQISGYTEVRLAQRPNQSTGWIRSSDARVTTTPYFVVVDLFTTSLTVYDDGTEVGRYPVGVGTTADPTPTGTYFIAFAAQPDGPGYGPVVLATSAHSNVIQDWGGSGDALIAIHGPLGADAAIGTTGARITHGCIRMHVADQQHLVGLPAGTPMVVVS